MDYSQLLERSFLQMAHTSESRLGYLAEHVFGFTTDSPSADELLAAKAVEVCAALGNRTMREYVSAKDGHLWFLLMFNMPFFAGRLDWGTSMTGSWWSVEHGEFLELDSCGLWTETGQLLEPMRFTLDQWKEFINAVVAFAAPELGPGAGKRFAELPAL